ncbi:MAG: Capsular glucan synthase [Deltaproteobacteria bacterium ADurb.Bin026]|jgi:glycosyltransferase involved in cell wall biosynthesis|nr:glycosyltransferase family 4 protein [Syntrophorhabdaceae bacterium]OQC47434.1 MAG: Capsular glucan synthase [Deltaproteobacteria bacterium ADurb.Bin026]HOS05007.1 glycosyltransferase family 4 protein [Syntrophorhabdaceae bacterium]
MNILLAHNFYKYFAGEDSIALREKGLLEENKEQVYFYTKDNKETDSYNLNKKINFFAQTIFSSSTKKELKTIIKDFKPDIAYTHNIFPLISPSIFHTLHAESIPCVQNVQDYRWLCPNGVFYINDSICEKCKNGAFWNAIRYKCFRDSFLLSGLYATTIGTNRLSGVFKKIDAFVCTTEFNKQKLMEAGIEEKRLFIKPNYLDITNIEPSVGTGNHIIFLGRLSQEKGLWTLIKAFEKIKDLQLKIVGTGPLEHPLRKYIKENSINNISIEGFKEGDEKNNLIKNALFMVFPSEWYEHFPIVLLEAFAFGKPVIASDIGNMPLIVENEKSGLHFKAGDIDDLIEKIRILSQNNSEITRMGEFARKKIETYYTPEINYKILKSIFQKVAH